MIAMGHVPVAASLHGKTNGNISKVPFRCARKSAGIIIIVFIITEQIGKQFTMNYTSIIIILSRYTYTYNGITIIDISNENQ